METHTHDIGIPRPKSQDIEIPRPKNHDIEKRIQLIVIPRHFFRGRKPRHRDSKTEKPWHYVSKTKKPRQRVSVELWPLCPLIKSPYLVRIQGKYGSEKLRIRTLFTQCLSVCLSVSVFALPLSFVFVFHFIENLLLFFVFVCLILAGFYMKNLVNDSNLRKNKRLKTLALSTIS